MPLYDFEVLDSKGAPTGEIFEEFVGRNTYVLQDQHGRTARRREVHLIADIKTRWGDSHAFYDPDLKAVVSSQRDIDRICEARGWVPASDMPKGALGSSIEKQVKKMQNDQLVDQQLQTSMSKHGLDWGSDLSAPENLTKWAEVQHEVMPLEGMLTKTCAAAKTKITDF